MAPDAAAAAPNVYTVLFENERVRLVEARVRPGDSSPLHSHPDGLVHVVRGGEVTFESAGGHRVDVELKAGLSRWREAEEHTVTSRGETEVVVLIFEPK
jgi:quercetin dioxygenase-like cupin family protein